MTTATQSLAMSFRNGRHVETKVVAGRHRVRRGVRTRCGVFVELKCGHFVGDDTLRATSSDQHDCVACEIVHDAESTAERAR